MNTNFSTIQITLFGLQRPLTLQKMVMKLHNHLVHQEAKTMELVFNLTIMPPTQSRWYTLA